jgi:hypothetical protein
MKRVLAVLVLLITAGLAANAQGFSFGGKLGASQGLFIEEAELMELGDYAMKSLNGYRDRKIKPGIAFMAAGYGGYYFNNHFGLQAELNFMFNQSIRYEYTDNVSSSQPDAKQTYAYSSLDIPLLIKYEFLYKPGVFGILAGPYLSLPLGDFTSKIEVEVSSSDPSIAEFKPDGAVLGVTAGLFGGYTVGPGRIIGDLRFLMDFSPLTTTTNSGIKLDLSKRYAVTLTLGYEVRLGVGPAPERKKSAPARRRR